MSDDLELADLLGAAPPRAADPAFRFDVFSRVSVHARRRAARERALNQTAVFAAIGLVFPVAKAAGLTMDAAQPMLWVVGALVAAGAVALLAISGPRRLLARGRAALLSPLLRA